MVLNPSDYKIPAPGQTWNPGNPKRFLARAAGAIVAVTVAAYVILFALRRGVPFLDGLLARVGLDTSGDGEVPVFS